MENKQPTMIDLLIEAHAGLERQGPGSMEMTLKAISFLDEPSKIQHIADLGCGSGSQTIVLAKNLPGNVTGLDLFPEFIDILNGNAKKQNLEARVKGIAGSMEDLPFPKDEFDLIWSEGAIDNIGFEKGLTYWHSFLKKDGYVIVTCPSWFTEEHPAEVEKFWVDAGSGIDTIEHNIGIMMATGYQFVASFTLPETSWTDCYFAPRTAALEKMSAKYAGNETFEAYLESNQAEVALYLKYKQHYGYAFYIGRKI